MTNNVLCHLHTEGFQIKPQELAFYGKLRERMIQKPWDHVDEQDFVNKVAREGHPFYGCIFNGHDLMHCSTQSQRECWKAQTIIALDFDKVAINPRNMVNFFTDLGYLPWLAYTTFSDRIYGFRSFRILWKVEVDLNVSYEQWAAVIKGLSNLHESADPRARDCTRMWQGGTNGVIWHVPGLIWRYNEFVERLGL